MIEEHIPGLAEPEHSPPRIPRESLPGERRLVEKLMRFARVLRAGGISVGPGHVIDAIRAVEVVGVTRRVDVYWALHAVFVHKPEERALFAEAFRCFWREPGLRQEALGELTQTASRLGGSSLPPAARRVRAGLEVPGSISRPPQEEARAELAWMGYSPREVLRKKDFEQMSVEEIEEAKRAIEQMELPLKACPTRRFRPTPRSGRIDMRRSFKAGVQGGGGGIPLRYRMPVRRRPPLVALLDISGSMGAYTRMFLHFLHVLTRYDARVETFLFGTRLSRATRHLRSRDADVAFAGLGEAVEDWAGGTRIGGCLGEFNRHWARRVLARGAAVLLMTDGLERDEGQGLMQEMERLQRSCRRLIWLNPLLRYEAFEPKAHGIRTMLPCVDDFRPVHNLESLEDVTRAVSGRPRPRLRHAGGPRSP